MIKNIPDLTKENILKVLNESFKKTGARVLMPDLDIYIPTVDEVKSEGHVFFLVDGWVDVDPGILEEEESSEDQQAPVEPPEMRQWACEVCTLLNPDNQDICLVCETPKPLDPVYPAEEAKKAEEEALKLTAIDQHEEVSSDEEEETLQVKIDLEEDEELGMEPYSKIKVKQFIYSPEEDLYNPKSRKEALKKEILAGFERLTPDKRIEIMTCEEDSSIMNSDEFDEFVLCRMTNETVGDRQDSIFSKLWEKVKTQAKYMFPGVESSEDFANVIFQISSHKWIRRFSELGIDFWLNKSTPSFDQNESIESLCGNELSRFKEFIEQDMCQQTQRILEFSAADFRLEHKTDLTGVDLFSENLGDKARYSETKLFFAKLTKLNNHSMLRFKTSVSLLRLFNRLLVQNFRFISMFLPRPQDQESLDQKQDVLSLGSLVSSLRGYIYRAVKNKMIEQILEATTMNRDETPKIIVERFTREKEITDQKGPVARRSNEQGTVFVQGYSQLKHVPTTNLRPVKPKGAEPFICFEVVLKNEHVQGLAGPYRQFFTDVSSELQFKDKKKDQLELLVESPNRVAQVGDHKEKYCLRASANSAFHLQLFEYLGKLMGMAYRTGTFVLLDLPTIFWKKMLDLPLLEIDLEEIDKGSLEYIRFLRNSKKEEFEDVIDRNFTATLTDGSEAELLPGGAHKKVTFENREQFICLFKRALFNESDLQVKAVRKGFTSIIPEVLLRLVSPNELETRICGKNKIDFDLLRKHTVYKAPIKADSPLINNFWSLIKEFSPADQLKFVKFCWGQERLPSTDHEYAVNQIRFMIKPITFSGNQDGMLPRSDTCFFNLELPNYSTKEIMRERILLAINTDCDSMNADVNADNIDEGNMDHIGDQMNRSQSWVYYSNGSQEDNFEPDFSSTSSEDLEDDFMF
jgi:other hect domain ubiquitin protein ligase E3